MLRYRAQIKLDFTASEWQLYSSMEGVEEVAKEVNQGLSKAINEAWQMIDEGVGYNEALKHINNCFDNYIRDYDDFGLSDSEPLDKKSEILSIVFNHDLIDTIIRHNPNYPKKTGFKL
jgi:hypothetical protein